MNLNFAAFLIKSLQFLIAITSLNFKNKQFNLFSYEELKKD